MARSAIPRPIRDPTTLIPIPAPSFVASATSSRSLRKYIYVERKDVTAKRIETHKVPGRRKRPSVKRWMDKIELGMGPPEHCPWEAPNISISSFSSRSSIARALDDSILSSLATTPNKTYGFSPKPCQFSCLDSAYDLPSFDTCSSLLRGSLPSISSTTSSVANLEIPPFPGKTKLNAVNVVSATKDNSVLKVRPLSARSSNRDASILDHDLAFNDNGKRRHWSLDVSPKDMTPQVVDLMIKLQDLNSFFDDGMKEAQCSLKLLDEGKHDLTIPSLIVSNSNAVLPIALESFNDLNFINPSLAARRGKSVLPLASMDSAVNMSTDYPDIPTAFRGSPTDETFEFSSITRSTNGTTLGTDEMIANLQALMRSLEVKSLTLPAPLRKKLGYFDSFAEAEQWLLNELKDTEDGDPNQSIEDVFDRQLYEGSEASTPPLKLSRYLGSDSSAAPLSESSNTHLQVPSVSSNKKQSNNAPLTDSEGSYDNSIGSVKRVRFDVNKSNETLSDNSSKRRSALSLFPQIRKEENLNLDREIDNSVAETHIRPLQARRMTTGSTTGDGKASSSDGLKRLSMAAIHLPIDSRLSQPKHTGSLSSAQSSKLVGVLSKGRESLRKSRSVSELFSALKSSDDGIKKVEKREEKTKSRGNALQELLNIFKN